MRQGQSESSDEYLKYFKSNVISLKLDNIEHILYDKELYQKVINIGDVKPSKD